MAKRTYEVRLSADATRYVKVSASSAQEAADLALARADLVRQAGVIRGGWLIDQGAMSYDEAVTVLLDGKPLGPWADESYDDDPPGEG